MIESFNEFGESQSYQLFQQARSRMDSGDWNTAIELFAASAKLEPHFKCFELLGECHLKRGSASEAIPYLAAAVTLNRGARAAVLLAEAWMLLENFGQALASAEIALGRSGHRAQAAALAEEARRRLGPCEARL
ncbi:MAG: hypothetical protein RL095_2474 [Verrucomicrobiota bacterium]|jgi:tetratricopeptide (TPR) repeat protein